jgi:hypothetical protein
MLITMGGVLCPSFYIIYVIGVIDYIEIYSQGVCVRPIKH